MISTVSKQVNKMSNQTKQNEDIRQLVNDYDTSQIDYANQTSKLPYLE